MQTILLELFLLLPFISGPAAIYVIAKKMDLSFKVCDIIISGVLLGNFVLIGSSILVGFFSNYLDRLFVIYTLLSLTAIVVFSYQFIKEKRIRLSFNINSPNFEFKIYTLLILLFTLFVLFYHTLYLEYDGISIFLPYAKSIASTGSMKYNIYDRSTLSTGIPPVIPLVYAWAFTNVNALNTLGIHNDLGLPDIFRPIPAAYFLLTALVIYHIARETLQKKHAFLSVIIFMSFPGTILTLSSFIHYLDLGFVFYLVSAILCSLRALKTRKPIWFFFTGITSSLLLLTKELSVFIVPLIFSTLILFSKIKYRRAIFAIISTSPLYLIFIWDSTGFPTEWLLMRQLPVIALSVILYYISKRTKSFKGFLTLKNLVLFLIPFIPTAIFFSRGIALLGSLYSIWGPAFTYPNYLLRIATGTTQKAIEMGFFRWDIPFISLGLGASYLIPILLSIVLFLKRRNQKDKLVSLLVLIMLFTLLEVMSFTLVGLQTESRRLYYFAPILAILAANGLIFLDDFWRKKYFIYLCLLFNSFVISYVWLYRFPFQTLLELSYLKKSLGLASILDLASFFLVFVCIFLVIPFVQKKLRKFRHIRGQTVRFHISSKIMYFSLFTLSCLLVIYPTVHMGLQGVNRNFDFFSFQYDVHEQTWENGIIIVSYYYDTYIVDHYVTVSFGGSALRYFGNRSVIDLGGVMGVQSMQNILSMNTSIDLLPALNSSNIKYFLIPRSNNSFYDLYLGFQENFYLFRFIEDDNYFSLVKEFDYYKLLVFENHSQK